MQPALEAQRTFFGESSRPAPHQDNQASGIAAAVHVASQWEATGHSSLTLAQAVEIGIRFNPHLPAPVQDTLLQAFAPTGLLFASTVNAHADANHMPYMHI